MKLVLGNSDYYKHLTDEGLQLQKGLESAGWTLAGRHLTIDSTDVQQILEKTKPSVIFVQDVRDWDRRSSGCFDKSVCFDGIELLKDYPALKLTVVKDAGSLIEYQRDFAELIGADAILHYYHEKSILKLSPWLANYRLIRIYHTVDGMECDKHPWDEPRRRGLVSGALSSVYPLRQKVFANARYLGLEVLHHPGYGNRGCYTPNYLRKLTEYKTHVCTASSYGFALRKIVESVAMGCTPITDLPAYDELPHIDGALVRVSPDISMIELRDVIDEAQTAWNLEKANNYAAFARALYDYPHRGQILDAHIGALMAAAA